MYHQPSKRKLLIRRIVSYGFMTVAVVVLVTVLVFVMLGYRYNGNDGKIEQGGLVQFDTQPNGGNWQRPTSILPPRFARFNVTVNY